MAQLHTANDLVQAIGTNTHGFVARVSGPHQWFISANMAPVNGKLFTGTVQVLNVTTGQVVVNGPGGGTVGLTAGQQYKWNVTGVPNSTVIVNIADAT
jgi:hypothetical protein